jgi:serine/threonine protein kinase
MIHRDVKPGNLLLDKKGTIKVLDMGLAQLNQPIGPEDSTVQPSLTGTGQAMGTIDFMPPEQAENVKMPDERSDVHSLGCTLYYLLTVRGGERACGEPASPSHRPIHGNSRTSISLNRISKCFPEWI